jgi:hypothetical protein
LTTWSKPRIERPMPYIRDSFFAGREFTSLAQMQTEALRWSRGRYTPVIATAAWMVRPRRRCSPRSRPIR